MSRKPNERGPDRVDIEAGKQLRKRRCALDMSQSDLGAVIDVSFQQIQKYERGTNRISASRLFKFANHLDVPVSYFFETVHEPVEIPDFEDPMKNPELNELVNLYYQIDNPHVRRNFVGIAQLLSKH